MEAVYGDSGEMTDKVTPLFDYEFTIDCPYCGNKYFQVASEKKIYRNRLDTKGFICERCNKWIEVPMPDVVFEREES